MDILVNCGGNVHELTREEKRVVAVALRALRARYEAKADGYRQGPSDDSRARLANAYDGKAAAADEVLAYFE